MNQNIIYNNIERRIKNNEWINKRELSEYLIGIKNQRLINEDELQKLLDSFDGLDKASATPLNMENYKGVGLENQNLIVSTKTNQILKTTEYPNNLSEEFRTTQNEIIANTNDAHVNADTVFNYMAENKKEEASLISIEEALNHDAIDIEMLQKIKFFISNQYINPYEFKVDITKEIFYNIETSEVLEVRQDEITNEYKIFKGSEVIYGENYQIEEELNNTEQNLESEKDEEEKIYENREKPKVRTLRPPQARNYNSAAFSSINILIFIITLFSTTIIVANILNRFMK